MSASSVTISGAVTGNLLPDGNNTRDIGSGILSWRNIYASGTSDLRNLLWVNATGTNTTSTNLFATNFQATNILSNLVATPNNTYDLGSAALSWENIYASGTLQIAPGAKTAPALTLDHSNSGIYSGGEQDIRISRAGTTDIVIFNANGVNINDHAFPGSNGIYDLGKTTASWRNIYASTSLVVPGGSATVPSVQIGDSGTGFGIFAPVAGYSVGITTAGVQRFKCDVGDCTTSADLYVSGNLNPNNNNTKDIGLANNSWRNIYASGTINLPNTTAATPGLKFGATQAGIFSNGSSIGIATAGAQRLKCDASDCTVNQSLYLAGNVYPNITNTLDVGLPANSFKNIYASGTLYLNGDIAPSQNSVSILGSTANRFADIKTTKITFGNAIALNNYAVSYASTTVGLTGGASADGDVGWIGREFIFTGDTLATTGNTLSLIESPTSTLKVTNGGATGLGGIFAATSSFYGVTSIFPAQGMTTSTLRVGSSSLRGCLAIGDTDGAGVTWCTTLNGVMTCSDTLSCE